jgi:hypothetical protein
MPASYPTAVKTFTTKNAGDTIQPAHINDLQDEVVAIEQGLLGGASPLQSSNSTLANLSVPGLSTFAGDVTMSGTLTVNKIVSTSIASVGAVSYVQAYPDAVFQFSSAAGVVACNQRVVDLSSEYDSTTYTFTPKSTGFYSIAARALAPNVAASVSLGVFVNSTLVAMSAQSAGAGNNTAGLSVVTLQRLSSGSVGAVQIKGWMDSSTGSFSSGLARTALEILKIF